MSSYLENLRFSDRQTTEISADDGLPPYENDTWTATFTETKTCAIGKDGIRINYDLDTPTPKYFEMTKDGVVFAETGQPTYTTGLGRLAAVQQAFQAVELPPNATTLKLNDTILLDDGTTATYTIDNTGGTISAVGTFGTQTNIINKNGYEVGEDDGLGHFGRVQLQRDNLQFAFANPPNGWDFDLTLKADTAGGFCGIDHIDRSSTTTSNLTLSTNQNLVFTADNIDLSSTGRLLIPNPLTTNNHLDYNAGKLTINNVSVGGASNPALVLQNTNNTAGSVAIETYKNKVNGAQNDTIASWGMFAKDYTGAKTEFARINSTITNSSAGAGNDGAVNIWCSVNGTIQNVFTFNGADNENNSFRPLDLTGNELKTSSGNITINALASTGTGDVIITPKTGANVRVGKTILTNDKIQNLTSASASSIDLASTTTNKYTIDKDKVRLDYTTGGGDASVLRLENDLASVNNIIYSSYTTSTSDVYESYLQNIPTSHLFRMANSNQGADIEVRPQNIELTNVSTGTNMNINNSAGLGTSQIQMSNTDGITSNSYNTIVNCNPLNQYLLCRSSDGTSNSKSLYIRNETSTSSTIEFVNQIDSNPLNITSNQDLNISSTKAGGFVNITASSGSVDIEATTDNLTMTAGSAMLLETTGTGANIEFKPESSAGGLIFTGTALQSNTSSGNSGEHLVITLNGTQYKIKLELV